MTLYLYFLPFGFRNCPKYCKEYLQYSNTGTRLECILEIHIQHLQLLSTALNHLHRVLLQWWWAHPFLKLWRQYAVKNWCQQSHQYSTEWSWFLDTLGFSYFLLFLFFALLLHLLFFTLFLHLSLFSTFTLFWSLDFLATSDYSVVSISLLLSHCSGVLTSNSSSACFSFSDLAEIFCFSYPKSNSLKKTSWQM